MNKNQGWDDRRSVFLERSRLLDKSANNTRYSTHKDRSFFDYKRS